MKRILFTLAAFALIGCQQAPVPDVLPPLSFANQPKIRIAATEIRVVENYVAPARSPNIDHMFPVSPTAAIKQWANDRLQTAGSTGIMEISIDDASVVEVPLPKTEGVRGFFTDDQSERYDGKIRVTMRLFDGQRGIAAAEGDVNVIRSRSINEKASLADRERMFHSMTKEMMDQFNTQAEARLRQYFSAFLR